jgi:hypothetical protein
MGFDVKFAVKYDIAKEGLGEYGRHQNNVLQEMLIEASLEAIFHPQIIVPKFCEEKCRVEQVSVRKFGSFFADVVGRHGTARMIQLDQTEVQAVEERIEVNFGKGEQIRKGLHQKGVLLDLHLKARRASDWGKDCRAQQKASKRYQGC